MLEETTVARFSGNTHPPGARSHDLIDWRAVWFLRISIASIAGAAVCWNPYQKPAVNILLGVVLLILGTWPLHTWLRKDHRRTIPLFPLHLLFYALCFAIPAFIDPPSLTLSQLRINESSHTIGLIAAIIGVVVLYVGHFAGKRIKGAFLARLSPRFPTQMDKQAVVLFYPVLAACSLLMKMVSVPALDQVIPLLRFFCLVWILFAAWSGALNKTYKLLVIFFFLPVEFILFSGLLDGFLVGILLYGELIIVCSILCKNKAPLTLALIGALSFVSLQPVKDDFRSIVWSSSVSTGTIERAELLADQAEQGIRNNQEFDDWRDFLSEIYSRLNHLSTTSAIIQEVDITHDFERGRTLLPLVTKWVPRAVWPDKPIEDLGNRWGRKYGFLDRSDYVTSYNLPWLPEMFMNFGWAGIVIISLLVGLLIAGIENGIMTRVYYPVEMAFAYIIAVTFFFPESNISVTLGGLIINWITIAVFLFALRLLMRIHNRRNGRSLP